MKSREVKETAKSVLKGKWKVIIPCFIVICILGFFEFAISSWKDGLVQIPFPQAFKGEPTLFMATLLKKLGCNYLIGLPMSFCTALLTTGIFRMFYCWTNGEPSEENGMFFYVKPRMLVQMFIAVVCVSFFRVLLLFLQQIVAAMTGGGNIFIFLLQIVFLLSWFVLEIYFFYIQYFMARRPQSTFLERIKMIQGVFWRNLWRILKLEISFIGWWIFPFCLSVCIIGLLGVFSFTFGLLIMKFMVFALLTPFNLGIGLYSWPYYHMSRVILANELCREANWCGQYI